jgi:hypothetical protein
LLAFKWGVEAAGMRVQAGTSHGCARCAGGDLGKPQCVLCRSGEGLTGYTHPHAYPQALAYLAIPHHVDDEDAFPGPRKPFRRTLGYRGVLGAACGSEVNGKTKETMAARARWKWGLARLPPQTRRPVLPRERIVYTALRDAEGTYPRVLETVLPIGKWGPQARPAKRTWLCAGRQPCTGQYFERERACSER